MKKEAMLYKKLGSGIVECFLCSHRCRIYDSKYGICGVRKNEGGTLYSMVYGEIMAAHVDPIEKKPLYHVMPESLSYSIATIGCNFKCGFCQNWQLSQSAKREDVVDGIEMSPEEAVAEASEQGCRSISYTYTEPTVFFEFAYDTSKAARAAGLKNVFVTNGFMTAEAIDAIAPYLDAANVDLKSFSEEFYAEKCKGRLGPVLDSIKRLREKGVWVEVTTLLIPGENDSDGELDAIADFISGVSKDIPWHISRFHPDYRFQSRPPTSMEALRRAKEIGSKHGLKYVYLGNVREGNDTRCHGCNEILVKRTHLETEINLIKHGKCVVCGAEIPGVWE